jgi:hypothetical protein
MDQKQLHPGGRRVEVGAVASTLGPVRALLAKKAGGPCACALAVISVVAVICSMLMVQQTGRALAAPARLALQSKPATNWSFYMSSPSTSKANRLGCNQGRVDKANRQNSLVILDFGAQASDGSGAYFSGTSTFISNGQIEKVSEAFAHGYWSCAGTGRNLTLALGTNNSGSNVGAANGRVWSHLVSAVQSYDASHHYSDRVLVSGAADIESWCNAGCTRHASASAAMNWAKGYSSVGNLYYNFGSADGCPENSSNNTVPCAGSWTQYDYWYVSWGNPSALPTPEIYNQTGAQARQWEMISLYSVQHHGGALVFQGPMDQHNVNGPGCCPGTNDTATQAWDQLWTGLHAHRSTAQNFTYSLEIHQE